MTRDHSCEMKYFDGEESHRPCAQKIYNAFVLCVDPNHMYKIINYILVLDCGIPCANAESECRELRGLQRFLGDLQGPPVCR